MCVCGVYGVCIRSVRVYEVCGVCVCELKFVEKGTKGFILTC